MGKRYIIVGTFFGIQLRIDYSWFIIFALIAWSVITIYIPSYKRGLPLIELASAGIIVTIIFFISVIAHEYAHSLVAKRRGLKIKRITLFLLGGASELQSEPENAKTELLMTVAGPLTSLVAGGIFFLLWEVVKAANILYLEIILLPVAVLNIGVGVFNLLPAFPMDGGRILRSVIWLVRKDYLAATRNASNVGIFLSYAMLAFGLGIILAGDAADGLWFGIIGFFLLQSAKLSYAQILAENTLSKIKIKDILNEHFITVPINTNAQDFLSDFVQRYKQYNFLAVNQEGDRMGIIKVPRTNKIPMNNSATVANLIQPFDKHLNLKTTDPAIKALRLMQSQNTDLLPVIKNRELVGVVSREQLEEYIDRQARNRPAK